MKEARLKGLAALKGMSFKQPSEQATEGSEDRKQQTQQVSFSSSLQWVFSQRTIRLSVPLPYSQTRDPLDREEPELKRHREDYETDHISVYLRAAAMLPRT